MVSHKLQQVSAAFASGVNPKVTGGRNLPLLAKDDDGPEPVAAAGTGRRDNMAGINMADNWSADPPACAIDIAQALRAGWLELWYQPKIGSQALDLRGAEALIRMRHPQLGIVQPANFMPATRDPHFRALSQFVIDIKVDRELISGCADDRSKRRLCQHIVDAAGQFGARTVAVGVETHADFVAARDLGFDLIQGFLFAKPMGVRTFLHTMPPE